MRGGRSGSVCAFDRSVMADHGSYFSGDMGVPGARLLDSEGRVYRRVIRMTTPEPGLVVGDLADDPHHFRVRVRHDGERVQNVEGEAIRYPWTTCPGATEPIRALAGMALSADATAAGAFTEPRRNCTHMFDLAGLCIALAGAGRARREYACAVRDEGPDRTRAELSRDGEPVLSWRLDGEVIEAPERYAGAHIHQRFMQWTRERLDDDEREAALVLRRACFVAPTRKVDLDQISGAADLAGGIAVCHSFQPENVDRAAREKGMQLDWSDPPADLVADSERFARARRAAS